MCLPFGAEKRRIFVSALFGQSLRCADRLRYLRPHDCQLSSLGAKLSPSISSQAVRSCVSCVHWFQIGQDLDVSYRTTLSDILEPTKACHACARILPTIPSTSTITEGMSPLGRYRCPDCHNDFCTECDVFVHDVVHCCPGCGK